MQVFQHDFIEVGGKQYPIYTLVVEYNGGLVPYAKVFMAAMTKSGKLVGKWAKVYPDDPFARDIETVAQMSVAFEKEFVWESMSDIQVTKESFMELMNFGWDKELKEFLPILRR